MKTLKLVVVGFILVSLLVMCGKKEESKQDQQEALKLDSAEVKTITPSEVGTIKLRLGYKKGDKFVYRLNTKAEQTQSIGEQMRTMAIQTTYVFTHEVMDIDSDQTITLKVLCDSVRVDAGSPMGTVTYNSNDVADSSKGKQSPFLEYAALAGSEFYSKITDRGDIIEVYQLDKIVEKLLGEHLAEVDAKTRQMIRDDLANNILRNLLQQEQQILPENPIGIDSSWLKVTTGKMETLDVKNIATYTLRRIEETGGKRTALIDAKLEATFAGKRSFEQEGVKYTISNPQISGSGTSSFDLKRGCVLRRDLSISTSLSFKISGRDKETGKPSSVELLQKMEQETNVQLLN